MKISQKALIHRISSIHQILADEGYSQQIIEKYFLTEIFHCQHVHNTKELNEKNSTQQTLVSLFTKLTNIEEVDRVLGNADTELTRLIDLFRSKEGLLTASIQVNQKEGKVAEKKKKKIREKKDNRKRSRKSNAIQEGENNIFVNNQSWGFVGETDNIFMMKKANQLAASTNNNHLFAVEPKKGFTDQKNVHEYLLEKEKQLLSQKMIEIQLLTELAGLNSSISTAGDFLARIM